MKKLCNRSAIVEAIKFIVPAGAVTELRALKANTDGSRWRQTLTGYFDDPEKLADAAMTIRNAKGIYIIPNKIDPALLCRSANHLSTEKDTPSTSDNHVRRRRWLLIDVDRERPAGISATGEEVEAAVRRSQQVYHHLVACGWPLPIIARSGNGSHLMYRIDLPADDGGLVQRCLEALDHKFTSDGVKIDTSVFNPARIWKLYGTLACKGDDTPERPHRMAEIRYHPQQFAVTPTSRLEALAADAPRQSPDTGHSSSPGFSGPSFDIDGFIRRTHLEMNEPRPWKGGGRKWTFRGGCPMCEHGNDGPFLAQQPNGAVVAGCHHESCSWGWSDLREKLEPAPRPEARGQPRKSEPAAPNQMHISLHDAANRYLKACEERSTLLELSGVPEINHAIGGGVERGEMVVVAALPGHGKTAFALQSCHVAAERGIASLIISEEMSALGLGKRTLQYVSPIPCDSWARDGVTVSSQLDSHFATLAPIHLVESCRTPEAVEREIELAVRERQVELVAVDYIQLLAHAGEKRYQAVSDVSTRMRRIATRHKIVLLALAQLNRELGKREKCVPRLADLRDSGQIEQDADLVMFLVRPYQLDSKRDPALVQVFVAKNRNREIVRSAVEVRFEGARQRFMPEVPSNHEEAFDDWAPQDEGVSI